MGEDNVNHWRASIAAIQARAGLDFGSAFPDVDTIALGQQPAIGAEALQGRLITRFEDLLLESCISKVRRLRTKRQY